MLLTGFHECSGTFADDHERILLPQYQKQIGTGTKATLIAPKTVVVRATPSAWTI